MSDDESGQTEWVTIKIHEPLREDAREDPRTYNDIMRAGLQMAPIVKSQDGDIDLDALAQHIAERIDTPDGGGGARTVDADIADELAKIRDLLEKVPDRTAEELAGGYQ